ncbi:MAG: hypothetical protein OXH92_14485 [Bryobacterales bacterium]|nr:hypothetical protein [Bryobacterales bacterium]
MTSLRLLAVLDVPSSTPARAKRRAPRPDGPLTHFTSPLGEKSRLTSCVSRRGAEKKRFTTQQMPYFQTFGDSGLAGIGR